MHRRSDRWRLRHGLRPPEIIDDDTVRERTLTLIRKYRAEEDVVPHWERIKEDRVILAMKPDSLVWRDW